jgi:hypothetical protein
MTKANFTPGVFAAAAPGSARAPGKAEPVIRSLVYRNALSAVLFVVAVIGIAVQIREIRQGLVFEQTRFTLVAYILIALYALASIAIRSRGIRDKR